MGIYELAERNMQTRFVDNPHRGIVIGKDDSGRLVQLAWIMGRSDNSQNRIYVAEDNVLKTKAFDESKVEDPRLIIYNVMEKVAGRHVVSNGDQTDTVVERFSTDGAAVDFFSSLNTRYCEPDAPIFTPRITGMVSTELDRGYMSVLKADPIAKQKWNAVETKHLLKLRNIDAEINRDELRTVVSGQTGLDLYKFPTLRETFELPLNDGAGYCLTTYKEGDSKNLRSFEGEPFVVPLHGELEDSMQDFWARLDSRWRVAIGGKVIEGTGKVRFADPINRHGGEK